MLANTASSDELPIHILQVVGNAIVGGVEKYVYNLARHLPAGRFKITCLVPYESSFTAQLRELGCEVFVAAMDDQSPPWRSIQFTAELIRRHQIDLVHAHLPRAHMLAGLAGQLTRTPVVATVHGREITDHELGISRTTGTHLVLVCREAYYYALALGMPAERISLIPNGVDRQLFAPPRSRGSIPSDREAGAGRRSAESFRQAIQVPLQAPLVGFVGRLAWEKGPDQFVQVAGYVHQRRPDVHFVMVGEGPMEDEIRDMIHAAQLNDCFHLAGVWENTWEIYPAFDALAQTSRVEGMPFAVLEAMACARPVAAMGVGGIPEMVEAGSTGLLSAPGDWGGLGEALLKLLDNPKRARQMGQAARKRVEALYDLQASIQLLADLFHRFVSRSTPLDNVLPLNRRRRSRRAESNSFAGPDRKAPDRPKE